MDPFRSGGPPLHPNWSIARTSYQESSESSSSADASADEDVHPSPERRPSSQSIEDLAVDLSFLSLDETPSDIPPDISSRLEDVGAVGIVSSVPHPKGARPKEYFSSALDLDDLSGNLPLEQDLIRRTPGSRPLYGSRDKEFGDIDPTGGAKLARDSELLGYKSQHQLPKTNEGCSYLLYSPPRDITRTDQHGVSPPHSPSTNRKILGDISERYGACGTPIPSEQSLTAYFPTGYEASNLRSIWSSPGTGDFSLETRVDDFFDDLENRLGVGRPSTPHPPISRPEPYSMLKHQRIWGYPLPARNEEVPPGSPSPGFDINNEKLLDTNKNARQGSPGYSENVHGDDGSLREIGISLDDVFSIGLDEDYRNLNAMHQRANEAHQRSNSLVDDANANFEGAQGNVEDTKDHYKDIYEKLDREYRKLKLSTETSDHEYVSAYEEDKAKNRTMPNSMKYVPKQKAVFKAIKEAPLYKQANLNRLFLRMYRENITTINYDALDNEIIALTHEIAAMEGYNPEFFDDYMKHDEAKFEEYKKLLLRKAEKVFDYFLIAVYLVQTAQMSQLPSLEYR